VIHGRQQQKIRSYIINGISDLVSQMNWDVLLQNQIPSPKATIEDNIRSLECDRHLVMGYMPPLQGFSTVLGCGGGLSVDRGVISGF
jgi:hypothetical protein